MRGNLNEGVIANKFTHEVFNQFCERLIAQEYERGHDGHQAVLDKLIVALTPTADKEISGTTQTWLAEATFREPSSVSKTPNVVEHFSARCPLLREALAVLHTQQRTHNSGINGSGFER